MIAIPDLSKRRVEAELMDSPALDRALHLDALDALSRVSAVSLAARRIWREVRTLSWSGIRPVRVLDVACGGGDLLLDVARRARRAGVDVELVGCDLSPVALERARGEGGDAFGVRFVETDVLRVPLPVRADVVCSSLFLHHLGRDEALHLLRTMAAAAERVLLLQDLRRTRLGYLFAWVGLGLLTRSRVARHDGLVSVAAALTLEEVEALCLEAGLAGAEVQPCWPQRFVLRWERP